MKIKAGDKFLCIRDVRMEDDNRLVYIEGNIYPSESEGCITDEEGEINHYWTDVTYTKDYFKKVKKTTSNQWSVIVWHTGTPDKAGDYIVTGKTDEGDIFVMQDSFMSNCRWWACDTCSCEVLAWCPISNINPYKEE